MADSHSSQLGGEVSYLVVRWELDMAAPGKVGAYLVWGGRGAEQAGDERGDGVGVSA